MKLNNSTFLEESLKKWKNLFIKEKKLLTLLKTQLSNIIGH